MASEIAKPDCVWTIGHSTRGEGEFLEMLRAHEIAVLADVRRFPGSRKYPHFGADHLRATLQEDGREYSPFPELGGRRRAKADSPNDIWRNASFRGYADYMETAEFRDGIARLLEIAREKNVALMCSEAVWWRCHRSMIADDLKAQGIEVRHIMGDKTEEHPYTAPARVVDGKLTYHREN